MPLLHSLRHETNFRAYPRLAQPEAHGRPDQDRPNHAASRDDAARSPVVATGLAGLGLRLGDGLDHLRSASAQLMQQLVGAATAPVAQSPKAECDPATVLETL